jgi:hypothetical protein
MFGVDADSTISWTAGLGEGFLNLVPGRYYAAQSQLALSEGRYLLSAGLFVAALGDAALGVATLGESTAIIGSIRAAARAIPTAGGVIRRFEQPAEQIYYRVFSENVAGKWLTAVPPRSSAWAQEALSLPPGNLATFIQEVRVPAGTLLERSRALSVPPWGRFRGGAEQFQLLEEIPLGNFGPRVPLP